MADYTLRYRITADPKNALNAINQVKSAAGNFGQASTGLGQGIASVLGGNLATRAFQAIASQAMEAGHAVFSFTDNLAQAEIAFRSLTGSSELASQHIKELMDLSKSTPLTFEAMAKMSQRLQGAGIAAKDIIPLLKDIGNVAAATGDLSSERLQGIAVALSQIQSKGRLSAEEMEQLAERGVPAWTILAQAMGKSQAEVRKLGEQGKLTSKDLLAAFKQFSETKFADALKMQLGTFSGAMQQIKNFALATAQESFKPLYDSITRFAGDVARSLQRQESEAKATGISFGYAIGEGIGLGMNRWMSENVTATGGTVLGVSGPGGNILMDLVGSFLANLMMGVEAGLKNPFPYDISTPKEISGTRYKFDPKTNTFVSEPTVGAPPTIPTDLPGADLSKKKKLPPIGSLRNLVISTGNPQWDSWLLQMGRQFDVDPNILLLQAYRESRLNPNVRSSKGAEGISQFIPATARRFGVNVKSVKDSFRGQAQYMALLLAMFGGDYEKALAGYNAGEGRVLQYKGVPPFKETREYIREILENYRKKVLPLAASENIPSYGTFDYDRLNAEETEALSKGLDKQLELEKAFIEQRIALIEESVAQRILHEDYGFQQISDLEEELLDKQIEIENQRLRLFEDNAEKRAEIEQKITLLQIQKDTAIINRRTETARRKEKEEEEIASRRQDLEEAMMQSSIEMMEEGTKKAFEYLDAIKEYQKSLKKTQEEIEAELRASRPFGTGFFDRIFQAVGQIRTMRDVIRSLGEMASDVFLQMAQGLGSMVESWVLMGDQADVSMKKMVASVLAGVAAQAATLAIFHLAMGIAALTPWGAMMYGDPATHFLAAAIWGGIAAGAAIAGRAVAGDSFKSKKSSAGSGRSSSSSGENIAPLPISRVSADAFTSGRTDPAVVDLAKAVEKLEQKIDSQSPGNILVAGVRQRRNVIGEAVEQEIRSNSSLGTRLLKQAGAR